MSVREGILAAAALLAVTACGAESDWPQFRGPTGDGVAEASDPPVEWNETKNITWKAAVPGRGRSSPVLQGDRIWLTLAVEQGVKRTRIGGDDMQVAEHVAFGAVCLSQADGKCLWQVTLLELDKPAPVHWFNSWATPTPVVEAGRLYCDFGTFGTFCLDAESGKVLWKQPVPLDHMVGPGSSPALCGNVLVLVRDGRNVQFVTALEKSSGQPVWKADRPPIKGSDGAQKKSFSTPLVVSDGARTQAVVVGAHWVVSYDPASGKELWRARHGDGFSIGARPVFGHGMVFFSTGCFKAELIAIRVDGQGDVTGTHIAWRSPRSVPVMSSPLLLGDEIYWVSDNGMVCCSDARTGAPVWQKKLNGTFFASPVTAAGRLYVFNQDGKATVLKTGRQAEQLAENPLPGPLVATPAFSGKAIFLRTDSQLYRIEAK